MSLFGRRSTHAGDCFQFLKIHADRPNPSGFGSIDKAYRNVGAASIGWLQHSTKFDWSCWRHLILLVGRLTTGWLPRADSWLSPFSDSIRLPTVIVSWRCFSANLRCRQL